MQRKEDQVKNAISAFIYIINLFIIQVCQSGSVGLGGPGCQCGPGGQGCPGGQGGPGGPGCQCGTGGQGCLNNQGIRKT